MFYLLAHDDRISTKIISVYSVMTKLQKIFVSLGCISVMLIAGCATDSVEKLAKLEKTQQQTQQELLDAKKQLEEANLKVQRYNELTDKYEKLIKEQTTNLKELEEEYILLKNKKDSSKQAVKSKLMESAQKSVVLQRRLKRYSSKIDTYEKKSEKLEEKVKATEVSVKETSNEISKIKKEIVKATFEENQREVKEVKAKVSGTLD
ncbi:hypothetical protein CDH04_01325 [Francisella adeliensis]|uniref:Uncharacterized protein n=2 Tax=Francisella adeliensis TaxID=2007306 RepID=A0A2Z4XWB3_9GAMM|nr:hypothetical protein CDH04_01325 [Francisella adeliensis]